MKKLRTLAAGAALFLLGGCATVSRPPADVPTALPAGWQAPLPHDGRLADLSLWWQQLQDPLLVDLIDAAQAVSPTVASARSRLAQAQAARASAAAALSPTLDASASVLRGNNQPPVPLATTAQAGLQAAWEIDLFGGRAAALDAARARLLGAQAGWHDARISVAAETAARYLDLRTCERQLAVARNDARSRAETARLTQLSTDAGFTAPASAALARASAADSAARLTEQQARCELDVKTLVALSGLPEPQLRERLSVTPASAPTWLDSGPAALFAVASVPARALAQRPDVRQAELEVAAASADVGAARADRYPRLGLNGSIAAGLVRINGATTDAQTWAIGPLAVSLPLFDGGRRAVNVDAAQARYEEAAAIYRSRVREAVREVEQAMVSLSSALARNEDARIAAEGFRRFFEATEARYRGGLASLVELEDARRTALAAETALVGLQRERVAAWIALYRALGGGWSRLPSGTTP